MELTDFPIISRLSPLKSKSRTSEFLSLPLQGRVLKLKNLRVLNDSNNKNPNVPFLKR